MEKVSDDEQFDIAQVHHLNFLQFTNSSLPGMHKRSNSSGTETTTDSVISSTDPNETPKSINLERNSSVRSVQPPNTLDIPSNCETGPLLGSFSADLGMRSDDTLVNGETENETQLSIEGLF